MRILLSEYIRTLKEREELDSILPQLLLSMKIVPLSKTQQGTRQLGVDLAGVGPDPDDQQRKIFFFVIKRGDIGRREWDSSPQSVRQSFNEILDAYFQSSIQKKYKHLQKVVILVTSGDLKEEIIQNWTGFVDKHQEAEFRFWGADELALLMEKYFLNEYLFPSTDREYLRQSLALAGEIDHKPETFFRLLCSQLELNADGSFLSNRAADSNSLAKRILILNLSTRLFNHWSIINENYKQPVIVLERALLWTWHRIRKANCKLRKRLVKALESLESDYTHGYREFLLRIQDHCWVRDGMAGSITDNAVLTIVVFELIGMIAAGGLFLLHYANSNDEDLQFASDAAKTLSALIRNNACSSSPRLDENIIDINLALILLTSCGQRSFAETWLEDLISRLCFSFLRRLNFPVNSLDELTSGEIPDLDEEIEGFNYANSTLANLAYWCTYFGRADLYQHLLVSSKKHFPKLCLQLWHDSEDSDQRIFFAQSAHARTGVTDAPILLTPGIQDFYTRVEDILKLDAVKVVKESSRASGVNFLAYRHFRTLVPVRILHDHFHVQLQ